MKYVDTGEQELLGFYRHFGLDFSRDYAGEQPDHLLTELAFIHYLSFLEAGARVGKDNYRRGRRDFLSPHLDSYSEALCERLNESTGDSSRERHNLQTSLDA